MREYIVNLTNNLIGSNGFDLMYQSMKAEKGTETEATDGWIAEFTRLVDLSLSAGAVREMSPETLGKVVCSVEGNELPCYTPASFFGKTDHYLRNIVSSMLAWSIRYRLEVASGTGHGKIPAYVSKNMSRKVHDNGFRAIIDDLKVKRAQKVRTTQEAVKLAVSTGLVNDSEGVMPEVLGYLKEHPDQVLEYGIQIQDAYRAEDRRTPIVKMALTLKLALQ